MNIGQIIKLGTDKIKKISSSPEIDGELLIAEVLDKSRAFVLANSKKTVPKKEFVKIKKLIERRSKGEPVAYILGKKEFYGLDFYVDENVLIPRPETEELVDLVVKDITESCAIDDNDNTKNVVSLVDVGTGSGCIGVTIANLFCEEKFKNLELDITFVDVSQQALRVAKKNYDKHIEENCKIKSKYTESDLLTNLDGKFDIIVANLPYIPAGKIETLDKGVKDFEPRKALDGGETGLDLIKKLILQSKDKLEKGGKVFLEIYHEQRKEIEDFVEEERLPFKVGFEEDLSGRERFVIISF